MLQSSFLFRFMDYLTTLCQFHRLSSDGRQIDFSFRHVLKVSNRDYETRHVRPSVLLLVCFQHERVGSRYTNFRKIFTADFSYEKISRKKKKVWLNSTKVTRLYTGLKKPA